MQTSSRITVRSTIIKAEDIKSMMAYCHYLVMKSQITGNLSFDGHKPTIGEYQLAEQCRRICEKISRILDICKVNEIPDLLEYYDITYRIGHKSLPDYMFISRLKQRVFKSWKTGDRSVTESQIFDIGASDVSYHPEKAGTEYAAAYRILKEKRISTLKKYARFPDATTYENYQRLALIMRENLERELGNDGDTAKRLWYERNRIDDLTTLGTTILRSYRRFVCYLFPDVLDYEYVTFLDIRILTELSTRADLHTHDRQAFGLAIEHNKLYV